MAAPTAPPPSARPPPTRAPAVLIAESRFAESAMFRGSLSSLLRITGPASGLGTCFLRPEPPSSVRSAQLRLRGRCPRLRGVGRMVVVGVSVRSARVVALVCGVVVDLARHAEVDDGQQGEDERLDETDEHVEELPDDVRPPE